MQGNKYRKISRFFKIYYSELTKRNAYLEAIDWGIYIFKSYLLIKIENGFPEVYPKLESFLQIHFPSKLNAVLSLLLQR